MEQIVTEARPGPRRHQPQNLNTSGVDYEPGMHVPSAVLDECNNSFTAADSNRVKASTQFFADTGLMALLCHHNRVFWLVNMTSAGEKQHYVLCLLDKLFQHIPLLMRLGVLYDIACQLHRSCEKFHMLLIVSCLVSLFFMHMVTNGPVRSHIILASVQVLVCQMVNQLRDSGVLSNSSFPLSVYLGIIIEFIPLIHKLSIWTINHCWSWVIGSIENGWQLQKEKKVLL